MLNKDNQGKVMTVLGPIEPNKVGNTTTHDHVLINFQAILTEPLNPKEKKYMDEKINLENIGWVRFNWSSSKDNLTYEDKEIAIESTVDASLMGGAIIRAGDVVIDGSVRGRLTKLVDALVQV